MIKFGSEHHKSMEFRSLATDEFIESGIPPHHAFDFVSYETYKSIYERMDLKGKKIIDLGAGYVAIRKNSGGHVIALEDKGATIIPIDLDPRRAKTWKWVESERENELDTTVHPLIANAHELPFPDKSIYGCTSINLVNAPHEDSVEFSHLMLSEVERVLADDGFVLISSFGYFFITLKDGSVRYNDGILKDEILTNETFIKIAREHNFKSFIALPLDEGIKAESLETLEDSMLDQYQDLDESDIRGKGVVEPMAFLIKK